RDDLVTGVQTCALPILVAVHDAVRPFIDVETIHKVFDEAAETGAAIVAVPAVDTIKQVTRGTSRVRVRSTIPREKLVMAQTPQRSEERRVGRDVEPRRT